MICSRLRILPPVFPYERLNQWTNEPVNQWTGEPLAPLAPLEILWNNNFNSKNSWSVVFSVVFSAAAAAEISTTEISTTD